MCSLLLGHNINVFLENSWECVLVNKSNKLVYGIGIKGMKYSARKSGVLLKEYNAWRSMLLRCTPKHWINYPACSGCTVSENFKSYEYFYEWCQSQVGFGSVDENGKLWCLDKDILIKGNKLYSEDTCTFVPHKINTLLVKCDKVRGSSPVGVCFDRTFNKFMSQVRLGCGVRKFLGHYSTEQEAFLAYKTFKEVYIKQVAEDYKGAVDDRVYNTLISYRVEIAD